MRLLSCKVVSIVCKYVTSSRNKATLYAQHYCNTLLTVLGKNGFCFSFLETITYPCHLFICKFIFLTDGGGGKEIEMFDDNGYVVTFYKALPLRHISR